MNLNGNRALCMVTPTLTIKVIAETVGVGTLENATAGATEPRAVKHYVHREQ